MKKKHYNAEYKQQAVYRVSQGHESIPAIAKDLGVSVSSLRDWIKQVEKRANPFPGSG
ncbi:MAG: transposase, partial [Thermaerobacter sp.]|nr:transposase [Thermaerobacter sp.]MBS4054784.1 transposase [Thermaerobacter sp.]